MYPLGRRIRPLLPCSSVPVVALLALGLSLAAAAPRPAAAVDLVLQQMTYVGSDAGEPGLVLEADRARIEHGRDLAHLENVRLDASGADGGASLTLTCDRALLNLVTSDFTAEGNVRGHTADGHRFRTEAATFSHEARVIAGDAPVDILDPHGTRLEGRGFHYDVRQRRMKMRNAVVVDGAEPFE